MHDCCSNLHFAIVSKVQHARSTEVVVGTLKINVSLQFKQQINDQKPGHPDTYQAVQNLHFRHEVRKGVARQAIRGFLV